MNSKEVWENLPKSKMAITDTGTELWESRILVNRAIWRKLSFREQQAIMLKIADVQESLDEFLSETLEEFCMKESERVVNLENQKDAPKTN
jgi:hypothetical protein